MVFRKKYFNIFKEYLEDIVGNEILMQKKKKLILIFKFHMMKVQF